MSGDVWKGLAAGIIGGVMLIAVIKLIQNRKRSAGEFDERQIAARGDAFKYGFFTFLVYFGVVSCVQMAVEIEGAFCLAVNFTGLCIATLVFAATAIWKDAYVSFNQSTRVYVILFTAVSLLNLWAGTRNVIKGDEPLEEYILNLVVGLMLLSIVFVFGAKRIRDKKTGREE